MNNLTTAEPSDLRVIRKIDKRQKRFIVNWMNPDSETFGNAYKSAIEAGYSESNARTITGNARNTPWIQEAKELYASQLDVDHIIVGLQKEALNASASRDRIRALELMAKIRGMFIERSQSEVHVRFNNNVPRPQKVDVEISAPND